MPTSTHKPRVLKSDEQTEYFFEEGCFILELSNHADDPAVSIARARLEPGKTTRLHALDGVVERYVILSGQGRVLLATGTANAVDTAVAAHDVVIIPPQASQQIENTGETDLVFLAICSPRFTPECYADIDPTPRS